MTAHIKAESLTFLIYRLLLALLLVSLSWMICRKLTSRVPSGKIVFQKGDDLYIMDSDGSNKEPILFDWTPVSQVSNPAASPDGRQIGFACKYQGEVNLCIIATNSIPDLAHLPLKIYPYITYDKIRVFPLPESCKPHLTDESMKITYPHFLTSLSWAPNGEEIALGCQNKVCTISLQNKQADCKDMNVDAFDWSPVDHDEMVVAAEGKICLYSIEKNTIKGCMAQGWSPSWSPDGQRIAYFARPSEEERKGGWLPGIQVIERDGSDKRWAYLGSDSKEAILYPGYTLTLVSPK